MRVDISIQTILVVGHYDRPRSSLSGHLVEMHGKWPMASCYFVLRESFILESTIRARRYDTTRGFI